MLDLLKQLINGLQVGSIYALVALGYTMVYGIVKLINFAHGDIIMVGSYVCLMAIPILSAAGLPLWLCAVGAALFCAILGAVSYTHLDVYKRQRQYHLFRKHRRACRHPQLQPPDP